MRRFVLASASPARLRTLQDSGIDPEVRISGVDEGGAGDDTSGAVLTLARRKAMSVADELACEPAAPGTQTLVLGCDSLLELDGSPRGKPSSPLDAVAGWRSMRGREGRLHTGHCLVELVGGCEPDKPGQQHAARQPYRSGGTVEVRVAEEATSTRVRFGDPDDAEIEAYVATGEPLRVAGGFTLDGLCAAWVEGIDGDPGTVIGLSMPALRRLLAGFGMSVVDLWR